MVLKLGPILFHYIFNFLYVMWCLYCGQKTVLFLTTLIQTYVSQIYQILNSQWTTWSNSQHTIILKTAEQQFHEEGLELL
jgi:hypothetical protein